MEKALKGSLTEQNLLKAFAGESQAKNRYTFFAEVARKDGYEQIAGIFYETALQEEMHAKRFFSYLEGGMVEITAAYPAGVVLQTEDNLLEAAEGEHDEAFNLYPLFGRIASDEGFTAVANTFKYVTEVEKMHENRYLKLLENVRNGWVFARPEEVRWYCRKCGYMHVGKTPPQVCPSCLHPRAFFELFPDNY
ncbi:rubrerythrin [Odoribacter lunatus]|uniref:rubrerythrin n=1 Tax=Odoribacter lunatus TaxID=2941335 RepID=UPI0020426D50|nr:rubrerythrin family protein [Odoribacter lunatus]